MPIDSFLLALFIAASNLMALDGAMPASGHSSTVQYSITDSVRTHNESNELGEFKCRISA